MPKKLVNIEDDTLKENLVNTDETDNNKKTVRKIIGRLAKNKAFADVRQQVIQKIFDIIGLSHGNGVVSIDDFGQKIHQIDLLMNDIRLAFNYSLYPYFKKQYNNEVSGHISLLKSLFKDMGYNVRTYTEYTTVNRIRTTRKMLSIYKIV